MIARQCRQWDNGLERLDPCPAIRSLNESGDSKTGAQETGDKETGDKETADVIGMVFSTSVVSLFPVA